MHTCSSGGPPCVCVESLCGNRRDCSAVHRPPWCRPACAPCRSHVPRVRVPGIKWEATSRRVLTMEWIDGVKLTNEQGESLMGAMA